MLISFPGGKCDPTDQDVVHTALRETHEELGLTVPEEHVWGVLRPVHDRVRLPDPEATIRDKEGGHGLWQADGMVEHQTPAWWSCSIPTQPIREGPGVS